MSYPLRSLVVLETDHTKHTSEKGAMLTRQPRGGDSTREDSYAYEESRKMTDDSLISAQEIGTCRRPM